MLAATSRVDAYLRTSAPHVYAAGDITGRWMLVPQAIQDGWVAATNAVRGTSTDRRGDSLSDRRLHGPRVRQRRLDGDEGARGARRRRGGACASTQLPARSSTIGRTASASCSSTAKRARILGCHVVGERAVEIVQIVAIAMSSGMRVDDMVRIPLSFPTYTGILVRAAYRALEQLGVEARWIPT